MATPGTLTLNVPWGHVAAKTWGNPNDRHILMVHGTMDNAGSFDRLVTLLPKNFYYVCIDLPGHGLSSHFQPGVPLNFFTYVLSIRYVLDALKWENTYYIGHSFGANIGSMFTIIYPERIRKLILLDGIIPESVPDSALMSRIRTEHNIAIEASKLENPRSYSKEDVMYAIRYLRGSSLSTQAAEKMIERSVRKIGDDAYCYNRDYRAKVSIMTNLNLDTSLQLLTHLKVETLLVFVSDTLPFMEYTKQKVRELLKDQNYVNIVEVKGNHDVHNNYPDRISDYISKFLNFIPSKF